MSNYFYTFPAIKGHQAGREYFTIMCPLGVLSKLFVFHDLELPPEFRAQRKVLDHRIPVISNYITDNPNNYVFSAITASLDGEYKFDLVTDLDENIGILKVSMESKLLINDGQHRKLAIDEALKFDPDLKNETISVVLFIDENLERSQQIFSDLNMHAINASRSISILYDSRDPLAMLVKKMKDRVPNMSRYVDSEHKSLSKNSNKLFLLSNLYNATKKLSKNIDIKANEDLLISFWDLYLNSLKDFEFVIKREISPRNFRMEMIISHGTVLEAIADLINDLLQEDDFDMSKTISALNKIDWSRSNNKWKGRVFNHSGRIVKNNTAIKLTKIEIKRELGYELNLNEIEFEKGRLNIND